MILVRSLPKELHDKAATAGCPSHRSSEEPAVNFNIHASPKAPPPKPTRNHCSGSSKTDLCCHAMIIGMAKMLPDNKLICICILSTQDSAHACSKSLLISFSPAKKALQTLPAQKPSSHSSLSRTVTHSPTGPAATRQKFHFYCPKIITL